MRIIRRIKNIWDEGLTWFLNYIVAWIPFWNIRKFFYSLFKMKLGKNCRILMGTWIMWPGRISIGDGAVINERCILDGGGGIAIGDNASLSRGTTVYSATHDPSSETFRYITRPVVIESNVWTGANSTILPGAVLKHAAILAAGSVAIAKEYDSYGIYSGVPAKKIGDRKLRQDYKLVWRPWFR